ncbi:MAG: hypothetical protein HQ522_03780 [Bacteroidetes bacterium]|nr:hypothetical protein [Bacteroidota bacterium]
MADILFNKAGAPLIGYGTRGALMTTTGTPDKKLNMAQPKDPEKDKTSIDNIDVSDWGAGNTFPRDANTIINKVGVLNSGLKFIRNFTIGQGIYPVKVVGYDDKGNEKLEIVKDTNINQFAKSRIVRRYMEKAVRDYMKFGCAFVQMIPSADGSKMVGLNTINALYARLSMADNTGVINKCITSGKWPENPSKAEYSTFDVLDEYDPLADLQRRKWGNKIKGKSFVHTIKDSWSNNEYYSAPVWYSAYLSGWVEIALSIPAFLKKAYENQITWKWHVQIPYAFWDKKFPATSYATTKLREAAITDYMDTIETNLCGNENASKPIFTMFEINPNNGKTEEQWIIEPLANKLDNTQNLVTSAAANSEILFSLMLNPNVLGAGMPGGTYAGNQGGSNIREAFLVNIANAWLDRQNILDPLETFIRFNGADPNIEWRFRNTILTTLDTGSGTQKTLS